ncbi:MAG: methionine ABC transporter ATP-binding protein [Actinomycetaceae bacterium]|nr:methionine ABC transporter ATP-binding protein [Actinomycetaceae bacterium]
MADKSPLIDLQQVTKRYPRKNEDDVVALDNVTLAVGAGDIHGIVGQSGAGKSTLIRCLTALETPTSGTITVAGKNLAGLKEKELRQARRQIGMVFQNANLLDSKTAAGNIAYPLALVGVPKGKRHERVLELLSLVGLAGRGSSYPSQLSGGQRQRVGIARALATNAPVLLCDEPTSALDSVSTHQILQLLQDLRDRLGVTIIVITHEMAVVREICDSVTMLEGGRVVETGRIEDVLADSNSQLSRELVPLPKVEDVRELGGQVATMLHAYFTSRPGVPTGSKVMDIVAAGGADIVGGTFETVGQMQVGRLALAVPKLRVASMRRDLEAAGITVNVKEDENAR